MSDKSVCPNTVLSLKLTAITLLAHNSQIQLWSNASQMILSYRLTKMVA